MLEELAEEVALELEQYLEEASDEIGDMVNAFLQIPEEIFQLLDEVAGEPQEVIFPESEDSEGLAGSPDRAPPVLELEPEQQEEAEEAEAIQELMPFLGYVEPTAEQYPACIGCKNYHGSVYGGNIVVCGMHPYGWDSQDCPDWEEM